MVKVGEYKKVCGTISLLTWINVVIFHEPSRLESSDGNGGQMERTQLLPNLLEDFRVGSVSSEPESLRKTFTIAKLIIIFLKTLCMNLDLGPMTAQLPQRALFLSQ